MTTSDALLLLVAAGLASALNAVAGGGGFIAFPSLVFTQVMPRLLVLTKTGSSSVYVKGAIF